jgi:hypothetical protein
VALPTFESMAFELFVDGKKFGEVEDYTHGNGGSKTLSVVVEDDVPAGSSLVLLAEELGYANYGFKSQVKKGLSGQPSINGQALTASWKMRGGLAGEHLELYTLEGSGKVPWSPTVGVSTTAGVWLQTEFSTPSGVTDGPGATQLLLHAIGLGRGRFWVNGNEVGRYYTLERNDASACPADGSSCPTQQYYHVPAAWLVDGPNLLTIFEASGATDLTSVGLATAAMESGAGIDVDPSKVVSCEM